MSVSDLPLHVQMLMALRSQVKKRQTELEARTGAGLEDRDYQRHVGRIAECKVQVEAITQMMRADLDDVGDYLEAETRELESAQRATQSDRRGKRRPVAPANHGRGA